jgi:hypothetical protein
MTGLAEWFQDNGIPVKLLDLDTENKSRGSLTHFFNGQVPKVNIHTAAGLDAFVDELTEGPPVILADIGGARGRSHMTGSTKCIRVLPRSASRSDRSV